MKHWFSLTLPIEITHKMNRDQYKKVSQWLRLARREMTKTIDLKPLNKEITQKLFYSIAYSISFEG